MGDTEYKIDLEIVEDLLCVERCSTFLGSGPLRPEFWEVFTLLKANRDLVLAEVKRLTELRADSQPATLSLEIHEKLLDIRREFYGLASDLRPFLSKHDGMRDGMRLELALVFIMGSKRGRESAAKWIADPDGLAVEAGVRVKLMGRMADAHCKALLDARRGAPAPAIAPPPPPPPIPRLPTQEPDIILKPQDPPAPPPPAPPVPPAVALPPLSSPETRVTARLHPQFLQDFEVVQRVRKMLDGQRPAPPPWEVHAFVTLRRAELPAQLDELDRLRQAGRPGEFAGATYNLRELIREAKSRHEVLAGNLTAYLDKTLGGWTGEVAEIATAILLGSAHGRHRAKQWIDDPEVCREEAVKLMRSLQSRAKELLEKGKGVATS